MKKLRYIILASAILLASCEDPVENDKALIDSFDHTGPAYVMMSHGMKAIAAASGTLIYACNFNEWLSAEGEEAKLAIEDELFPYLKIREVEENIWNLYTQNYTETYKTDGQTLNKIGAKWYVPSLPQYFVDNEIETENSYKVTISCIGNDRYEVAINNKGVRYGNISSSLYNYLSFWNTTRTATVATTLTIQTNYQAFRDGEEKNLNLTISGSGSVSNYEYGITFSIDEPIEMCFGTDGNMAKGTIGVGVVTMKNTVTLESVRVTLSHYNTIYLEYKHSGGGTIAGYYDWAGNILTPR